MRMEPNTALQIAIDGGNYLYNQIQSSGRFVYQRNSKGKRIKGQYNMLRHAGTIWAIKLMEIPIQRINEPISYMLQKIEVKRKYALLLDKTSAKLGLNALGIIAIGPTHQDIGILTAGLDYFINNNGHKYIISTKEFAPFKSEYYPGEAALAYATVGELDKCLTILKTLHRTKGKGEKIIHDHWALQAVEAFFKASKKSCRDKELGWLIDFVHETGQAIMSQPHKYNGRMCAMACRAEGLLAAYQVTKSMTYLYGAEVILTQLTYFRNKEKGHRCYGAFKQDEIYQIDYTQHAICAYKKFADIKLNNK